ncbi:MAG: hypothetical protein WBM04_08105 [Candidatus Korobacteraceae bacterium]
MSPRKSSQTTAPPGLPTIKDYFGTMAEEQAADIRRLKQAAAGKNSGQSEKQSAKEAVPDPWLLHPIRRTGRSSAKPAGKRTAPSASKKAPKKSARKAAKKASKKTRT